MSALLCVLALSVTGCVRELPIDEVCEVDSDTPDPSVCDAGLECVLRTNNFFVCSTPCERVTDCPTGRGCAEDGYCRTRVGVY